MARLRLQRHQPPTCSANWVPPALSYIRFNSGGHPTNPIGWYVTHTVAHIPNPGWAAFAYSCSVALFCFIPVWILYRKRIFLKV